MKQINKVRLRETTRRTLAIIDPISAAFEWASNVLEDRTMVRMGKNAQVVYDDLLRGIMGTTMAKADKRPINVSANGSDALQALKELKTIAQAMERRISQLEGQFDDLEIQDARAGLKEANRFIQRAGKQVGGYYKIMAAVEVV